MTSIHSSIELLLSPDAAILHTNTRFHIQKRIVRHAGQAYVLHRFRSQEMQDRFTQILRQMADAGTAIQPVHATTSTPAESGRLGHWVALRYMPGSALPVYAPARSIASLAASLAHMHELKGPANHAVFTDQHPSLPHQTYLADNPDLSTEHKEWVRQSLARLKSVPPTQLTHGDLHAGNVIRANDNSITLIDYELMAYEWSGIELGICLLRPFCWRPKVRRLFLRTYLRHCSPEVRETWLAHGTDFIFAAAARLSHLRKQRMRGLRRKIRLLRLRLLIAPLAGNKSVLQEKLRKHQAAMRLAGKRGKYFAHVARSAIALCLAEPDIHPLILLSRINKAYVALGRHRHRVARA